MSDVERLLRHALAPVEPPSTLADELERRLSELTEAAFEELTDWDPRALRDPRRWGRLIVAGSVAAGAGGALIVVRARHRPAAHRLGSLRRTLRLPAGRSRHAGVTRAVGGKRRALPIVGGSAR